jgi:hypothetical protein
MKARFIKWDYDTHEAVEYERTGECNGCAECCKSQIHYMLNGKATNAFGAGKMGDTTNGREGVWSEYKVGKMRRFIKLGEVEEVGPEKFCEKLKDNQCVIHAIKSLRMGGQGALCLAWPIIPEHVELFKKCSFSFQEINHLTFGTEVTP